MIKVFCDLCGKEYDRSHANMIGGEHTEHSVILNGLVFTVKIHIAVCDKNVDICAACRWDIVTTLDTRPKYSPVNTTA